MQYIKKIIIKIHLRKVFMDQVFVIFSQPLWERFWSDKLLNPNLLGSTQKYFYEPLSQCSQVVYPSESYDDSIFNL